MILKNTESIKIYKTCVLTMALCRPAGFSDDETDSDEEYAFFDKARRNNIQPNPLKQIESNLQNAIINGDLDEVQKIIEKDLHNNFNAILDSGWTPLMHACFHAKEEIAKNLLSNGADPSQHADSITPAMILCSNTSASDDTVFDIFMLLHDAHTPCVKQSDKYGQTPFMRAISNGRKGLVQKLVEVLGDTETRDHQGWTPIFWAVHHNQKQIVEVLIHHGARVSEVDLNGRTPLHIAETHDYQDIVELLKDHLVIEEENDKKMYEMEIQHWSEYYPGIKKGKKPCYDHEVQNLLYGMRCERLYGYIKDGRIDLRTFLLLEESDMAKLGIDMPFEQKRLKAGLRNFHTRGWKLNAVSGLHAQRGFKHIDVTESLKSLGNHLEQVYIIEATIQYALREYSRMQNQIKFEPPDSPVLDKLNKAANNILKNISSMRREMKILKSVLTKIAKGNSKPADLIQEKSLYDKAKGYITEVIIVISLGLLIKNAVKNFTTK